MARETKIGIALMALLLGVFGFVAYKKWDGLKSAVASKGDATGEAQPSAAKTEANTVEPPGNPFAAADPASGTPVDQSEPTGDPFADPVSNTHVPVRPVSATVAEEWSDPAPAGDGSAVAQQEPTAIGAETVPFGQGEPDAVDPATAQPPAVAPTDADVADSDPFGDAAVEPVPDASEAMTSEDPFASSGEAGAVAVADNGRSVDPAAEPVVASSVAEAPMGGDPFAEATSTSVASAEVSPTLDAAPASEPTDDPFGGEQGMGESLATDSAASELAGVSELAASPATDEPVFPNEANPVSAGADLAGIEPEPAAVDEAFEPAPIADESSVAGRTEYCVVAENDTYWSISQRVYGTPIFFQALAKFNEGRIQDPKRLRPGMKVLTPPASELTTRFPKLVAGRGAAGGSGEMADDAGAAGFLLDEDRYPAYRVGEGDTLGKIAQAHLGRASRWVQIYNLNRAVIPDAKALKPGTVLRLPADASRVRLVPEG